MKSKLSFFAVSLSLGFAQSQPSFGSQGCDGNPAFEAYFGSANKYCQTPVGENVEAAMLLESRQRLIKLPFKFLAIAYLFILPTLVSAQFNNNNWIEAFQSCEASFSQMKEAYPQIYNQGYTRCMSSGSVTNATHCMEVGVASVCEYIAFNLASSNAPPLPALSSSEVTYCKNLPSRREQFFYNREIESYQMQVRNCRNLGIVIPYY